MPGILTNNYFTSFDRDWYEAFVWYTVDHSAWADPIRAAAAATGPELEAAVRGIDTNVRATM